MTEIKSYENYPLWIPFIAIFLSIIGYVLGAIILSGFGIIIVTFYLIYCFVIELLIIFKSCKNCCYYGKICGLGKGKITPLFIKKGNPKMFIEKKISWYNVLPDFLVAVIPIIGGIILLVSNFSYLLLGLIILLTILFFAGTGFVRGAFACKYCKQKEFGCPAAKLFEKKK